MRQSTQIWDDKRMFIVLIYKFADIITRYPEKPKIYKLMKNIIVIFITTLFLVSCNLTKEIYESGELKKIGRTSNGVKTGDWKFYHKNGELFQKGKYRNENKIGIWKIYHENGKLHQIGEFNAGKQNGEWKFFF